MITTRDIFDLTVPNKQRYARLLEYGGNDQFEIIKRFMDIYRLSGIKKIEKFFIFICGFDNHINLYLKQEILQALSFKVKTKGIINHCWINIIFLTLKKALTMLKYWLLLEQTIIDYKHEFKDKNLHDLLKNIIIIFYGAERVSFKQLFGLLTHFKEEFYFGRLCTFFFDKYQTKLTVENNLLLLQIIFQGNNKYKDNLFHIINDKSYGKTIQLEACDILMNNGDNVIKSMVNQKVKIILPPTAYTDNSENVHLSSIVSSIDNTINSILKLNKGKQLPIDLYQELGTVCSSDSKIWYALDRICKFNFLVFTKHKLTLKEILGNIWLIIKHSEFKEELVHRLEQELDEMHNTCSQGYLARLINIFSGFQINGLNNLGIGISFEDEIYALFSAEIKKIIDNAPENTRNKLLEELMVPSNDHENRINLLRYLRPFISKIWNKIFEIYKDILTITELDLICRNVTMKYEGY